MLGLFKKPIERREVVKDIIGDILNSLVNQINERLGPEQMSDKATRETMAFIYMIGIFGIQASRLNSTEKHLFSVTLTHQWAGKLPWNGNNKNASQQAGFLHERLRQYRVMQGPTEIVQRYMQYLGIDSPEHVAFLGSTAVTIGAFNIVRNFINGIRKHYKFV